jgi:transcriptional regulator with XRE-family HTH domain
VAKLHSAQVLEILERIEQGQSRQAIAQVFGVSRQTLSHIVLGESWSKLTGRGGAIRTPASKSDFGRRVGDVLTANGLSMRWLASRVGCVKSTVSYIARGEHEPHLDRALAITEALSPYASREFLLWGEEDR